MSICKLYELLIESIPWKEFHGPNYVPFRFTNIYLIGQQKIIILALNCVSKI